MEIAATKTCYKCGEEKLASREFWYGDKRAKDGFKWECKICFNEMGKRWEKTNRDKRNEYTRRWKAANPEKLAESNKKSYRKHRKQRRADHEAWKRKNPERWNQLQRAARWRYKARKRAAEGSFSSQDVERIYHQQRGRCAICRTKLGNDYHHDHITPLSAGGSNWPSNIQLTCSGCNHAKSSRDPIDFMQSRGLLL